MSKSRMGQFRDRVRIEANKATGDDPDEAFAGAAFVDSWPCRIVPVSGNESFQGRLIDAEVQYVVEGWYASGVLPNMRCVVTCGLPRAAVLNVKYVHNLPQTEGKPALTQLHCTEIVSL